VIQALFVDTSKHGVYPRLLGVDNCWGVDRDARLYYGPEPVVAHPPCQLWTNMSRVNYKRYALDKDGNEKPGKEYLRPGNDGRCFEFALDFVRRYGGVLEHPAESEAWYEYELNCPDRANPGWIRSSFKREWRMGDYAVCQVSQATYGHKARKLTWLLYAGQRPPFDLNWQVTEGTHQCGWFDRIKPTLSKREASATPEAFAQTLIMLAEWSRG
jgi:hypothetical protein